MHWTCYALNVIQGGAAAWIAWLRLPSFWLFHPLPGSAWADGKLAEVTEQLSKIVEHHTVKVNPTQLSEKMNHPVAVRIF